MPKAGRQGHEGGSGTEGRGARGRLVVRGPGGAFALGGGSVVCGADLTLDQTSVGANADAANGAAAPLPFGGVSSAFGGGIAKPRRPDLAPGQIDRGDSAGGGGS